MVSSFVINNKTGREAWAEPIVENGKVHFSVHEGKCPSEKETNKYRNYGAKFRCPACGEITADDYVKKMGLSQQLGSQMMAMVIETENGKVYKAPSPAQEDAADVPFPEDIPNGTIPDNAHWFSPPGFGLTEYQNLFSARQMTMLTTFCDLLKDVQDKVSIDAMTAGYSGFLFYDDNGMPLVAMHWQHRFNHMVGRYNDIYRVQMPNITPHVCRHTYCSNMAKSGMNPKTLQYLMGHSDISVTMNVYTHIGFDDAEEELKRMEEFRKAQAEVEQKKEKPMSQKMFKVI